jgi:hypothetical protein
MSFETVGGSVWDGRQPMRIREARFTESETWTAVFRANGEPERRCLVWLFPVTNPNARRSPNWEGLSQATLREAMANLTNEQRRALRLLSRRLDGCAEAALLAEGFSIGQLAELALDGLIETKRSPVGSGRHSVWMQITEAGRKAITE